MEPELAMLLHIYKEVFSISSGLTPQRAQKHSFPLIQGSGPVKVRPHRHPHSQKLLNLSHGARYVVGRDCNAWHLSFFFSHSLGEEEGCLRFCTNYRALNAIIGLFEWSSVLF